MKLYGDGAVLGKGQSGQLVADTKAMLDWLFEPARAGQASSETATYDPGKEGPGTVSGRG